jgi:hypothetical protein
VAVKFSEMAVVPVLCWCETWYLAVREERIESS